MDRINEIILRLGDKVREGSTCSNSKKRIKMTGTGGEFWTSPVPIIL